MQISENPRQAELEMQKNILSLILESRRRKVQILRGGRQGLEAMIKKAPVPMDFKKALRRPGKISLIGEIKQASPSNGILRQDFDPAQIAGIYERAGVVAISVLTEEEFFLGKLHYIEKVKQQVRLPVLRKDFIVDEIQILESRAAGADAVLLILRILDEPQFVRLYALAKDLGMDVLVEAHSEKELRLALKCKAEIIGLNSRNLSTLKIDPDRTSRLVPFVPEGVVKVSESGVSSVKDMLVLKGLGVDSVLVGSALMKAPDIEAKVKELNIDA
jgi:indole-3-glycerol phosphate synthase